MKSTIQLRQGDMFAQPTDLIVIPCSTGGTVTGAIASQLEQFDIKWPTGYSNLGDVKFELFNGASNIAAYVGYATSVQAMESSQQAISKIAETVSDFIAEKPEIRDVAIPLLGAGSGRLTPAESLSALMTGFEKSLIKKKVINIFVYKREVFEKLSSQQEKTMRSDVSVSEKSRERTREPLRVFISYTKTSQEHQTWVRDLATFLRENGVDARLDVWHLRPGMDTPQWMCNELDQADRVLIVCNDEYAARANGRLGGVGWEMRVIQGELLQSQSTNPKKFLPILRGSFDAKSMPSFLRGVYALTWTEQDAQETKDQLLREIYDVFVEAPPIGLPPRFVLTR
ncbi:MULTISPECIES: TIR domain-containing protein [unclassified Bradyrhizobium]|uniref:TIR domain-containing protein n=1 Tax=unclassified Bradyrhizobium TaxID=2631580 RepID=UPI002119A9A7|nr:MULTISPECIES: TIR domain-containing protein [unclassified Bradyrhizobium]